MIEVHMQVNYVQCAVWPWHRGSETAASRRIYQSRYHSSTGCHNSDPFSVRVCQYVHEVYIVGL